MKTPKGFVRTNTGLKWPAKHIVVFLYFPKVKNLMSSQQGQSKVLTFENAVRVVESSQRKQHVLGPIRNQLESWTFLMTWAAWFFLHAIIVLEWEHGLQTTEQRRWVPDKFVHLKLFWTCAPVRYLLFLINPIIYIVPGSFKKDSLYFLFLVRFFLPHKVFWIKFF